MEAARRADAREVAVEPQDLHRRIAELAQVTSHTLPLPPSDMLLHRFAFVVPMLLAGTVSAHAQGARAATVDSALVAQERSLYEALQRHDAAAFNRALGGDFVFVDGTGTMFWQRSMTADVVRRCALHEWAMEDVRTTRLGTATVVTFRWTGDETCNGRRSPSPVQVMSVWEKRGARWVAISHSETPVALPR